MAKKVPQKMTMYGHRVSECRKLLRRWGYACVVCGREFANLACVTREHIIPRSKTAGCRLQNIIAPSHYRCNLFRGNSSIIHAAKLIDKLERSMKPDAFHAWLNCLVPNRIVPQVALAPPQRSGILKSS